MKPSFAADHNRMGRVLSYCAVVLSVLCVCFSVHADVVKLANKWNVAVAFVTGALGGAVAQAAGRSLRSADGFCMWQPFRGGLSFVLLQYFGWLFYGVALMMFLILFNSHSRANIKGGTLSSVGLLASAAVLTLLASVPYFKPLARSSIDDLRLIKKDNLVAIACIVSGLAFSLLVEIKFERLVEYDYGLRASILALMVVAAVFVVVVGKHRYRGQKIFHPFQGGFYFVLMQSSGWAGYAVGVSLFISVAFDEQALPGILLSVAVLLSSSLVLLILSLDCFHEVEATKRLLRKLRLTPEMVACVLIGLVATATNIILDLAWQQQSFLSIFSVACHVLVAPSLHVFSSHVHKKYYLWQPFCGGPRFVLLQGIGWTLYAVSHVLVVLAVANNVRLLVGASSLFVFLSDSVICVSLTFFVPEEDERSGPLASPLHRLRGSADDMMMHGEIVTSLLMIIGGSISLITVDWYSLPPIFSKWLVCLFSMVLVLLSYGVAHLSGRRIHASYRLIHPFHGGPDHVVLQTVGWTIWGTLLAIFSVLEINLAVAPDHVLPGAITASTLLAVFGYCILAASVPLFQDDDQSTLPRINRICRVSLEVPSNPDEQEKWRSAAAEASRLLPLLESPELRQVLRSLVDEVEVAASRVATTSFVSARDQGFGAMSLAVVLSCASLVLLIICEILSVLLEASRRAAVIAPLAVCSSTALIMAWLLTHGVAGQRRFPETYRWWMPFSGGFNFALMQTVAWAFCSLHLATLSVIMFSLWVGLQLYIGSYVVLGFFGFTCQMLLVMSLSKFDPAAVRPTTGRPSVRGAPSFLSRNSEWFVGSLLTIFALCTLAAADAELVTFSLPMAPVIFCGTLALVLAVPLGWVSVMKSRSTLGHVAAATETTDRLSLVTEVFACTVIAVTLLQRMIFSWGNHWYVICLCCAAVVHHVGLLLTIVWNEQRSLYIVALELYAEFVTFAIYSFHYVVVGSFVYVGFFVDLSYASVSFFIAVNLLSYNSSVAVRTVQIFCTVVVLVEGLRGVIGPLLFLCPVLLYCCLYKSDALWDRSRFRPAFSSRASCFWECAARYFSLSVVSELDDGDAGKPMLFGFHPHGVCPYTSMWGTHCMAWRAAGLPVPVVHASSFLLSVPIVRDVLLALGVVDCSVTALRHTLGASMCALVVPGGLQEALQRSPPTERISLIVKNKGMFRLALQQGIGIVPVFCFGEVDIISGLPLPSFQMWAKRRLGVTYPQLPHGRLLLPLPRRQPVTVVVGSCIPVPKVPFPTPAEVDKLHGEYYAHLTDLFERHKAHCGVPDAQLILTDYL
jgi:hypothetical protein